MEKKRITAIVIGTLSAVVIIVLIAILGMLMKEPKLTIANIDQIETSLTDEQVSSLEGYLWQGLQDIYEYDDDVTGLEVAIRPDSYLETADDDIIQYRFLMDVDEVQATYDVAFGLIGDEELYEMPMIRCPSRDKMKYPETQICNRVEGVNDEAGLTLVEFSICGEPANRMNCDSIRVFYGDKKDCGEETCLVIEGRAVDLSESVLAEVRERLREEGYKLEDYRYIYRQSDR